MTTQASPPAFPKARPSVSADACRDAEIKRVSAMTVEERIVEALSLHQPFGNVIRAQKDQLNAGTD